MTISLATVTTKNAMLTTLVALYNTGYIKIYDATGGVPANADTALGSQVLLATLTFGATAFPAPSAGSATANAITQGTAAATATAAFYRAYKSDGTTVIEQGTVGTSGADLNLNTTSIVSGGPVQVTSYIRSM